MPKKSSGNKSSMPPKGMPSKGMHRMPNGMMMSDAEMRKTMGGKMPPKSMKKKY